MYTSTLIQAQVRVVTQCINIKKDSSYRAHLSKIVVTEHKCKITKRSIVTTHGAFF